MFFGGTPPVKRYKLVVVNIPAGTYGIGKRFNIGDQPELRTQTGNIPLLKYIETYGSDAIAANPVDNQPAPSATELQNLFIVLNVRGTDMLQSIPLVRLNRIYSDPANHTPYANEPFNFADLQDVDWQKSYLQWVGGNVGTSFSVCLGVGYDLYPDDFKKTNQ